ncbi:MAG: hypothetical protein LBP42_01120 [Treponema sp.]|jgi:hypothetical protein|nr:hypothetical protein [Treponema sp.]
MNAEIPAQDQTEGGVQTPEEPFPGMRDKAVLMGWIGGLLLLGALLWLTTHPLRLRYIGEAVNGSLISRGDPRRLGAAIPRRQIPRNFISLGTWYVLENSPGRALVFSLMAEGVQVPCAAIIAPEGEVEELIPLNRRGEQMLNRLSEGAIRAYIERIEKPGRLFSREEAE